MFYQFGIFEGLFHLIGFIAISQVIKAGDILATVIPDDKSRILVRAEVPASVVGRVRTGQDVNIKLSGFLYMEYGIIRGKISTLSLAPARGDYIADIDLVNEVHLQHRP